MTRGGWGKRLSNRTSWSAWWRCYCPTTCYSCV